MVSETFFCGTCCNCFLINIVYLHLQISIVRTMEFQIREGEDYIQLIQLLKVVGIACNGAQAQQMVEDSMVKVNGKVEMRKRAKLKPADTVEVLDKQIHIK